MNKPTPTLAERARVLAATAKCLEVLSPLDEGEQLSVIVGLVLTCSPKDGPSGQAIDALIKKMTAP